jgi:hypothetical protein
MYKMSCSENFREIFKCLRDGLSPLADESYKHLCLEIILFHISHIAEKSQEQISDTTKEYIAELYKKYNPDITSSSSTGLPEKGFSS